MRYLICVFEVHSKVVLFQLSFLLLVKFYNGDNNQVYAHNLAHYKNVYINKYHNSVHE